MSYFSEELLKYVELIKRRYENDPEKRDRLIRKLSQWNTTAYYLRENES